MVMPIFLLTEGLSTLIPSRLLGSPNHTNSAEGQQLSKSSKFVSKQDPKAAAWPTHRPISANKRAASLLKKLKKPSKQTEATSGEKATATNNAVHSHTHLKHTSPIVVKAEIHRNESVHRQNDVPKKKPYKTLHLNTTEDPHIYASRTSKTVEKKNKGPQAKATSLGNGFTEHTTKSDHEQPLYKTIEPETQDYTSMYTVLSQPSLSSCVEIEVQPIYEEPNSSYL